MNANVHLALTGAVLLLAGLAWPGTRPAPAQLTTRTPAGIQGRPIEFIRVGDRVESNNPQATSAERALADPDPATWRHLSLRMTKADGHALAIELLRPADWVAEVGATVGGAIQLNMPELGAQGEAQVLAVAACPAVKKGTGHVVTGTFKHEVAGGIVEVSLAEDSGAVVDRIGATSNHPFWSEDRQDFVPAGQLQANEDVCTHSGDRLRVASVLPRPGPATVYNLEVHGEHAYYVGRHATLVHNNGCGQPPLQRIHPDSTYLTDPEAKASLDYWRTRPTQEIIDSLHPKSAKPLTVRSDGRIYDGNTRTKVLEERGVNIHVLPRFTLPDDGILHLPQ